MAEQSEAGVEDATASLAERGDVFLAPIERAHFERTVASPVDPSEHEGAPDPIADREAVRLWGVAPGTRNEQTFEKLQPGDLVLFYVDGAFAGVGTVGAAFADPDGWVAETYWEESPARLVAEVTEFAAIDVPQPVLNRIFEYDPDYAPQGLTRVADSRVDARLPSIRLAVRRFSE